MENYNINPKQYNGTFEARHRPVQPRISIRYKSGHLKSANPRVGYSHILESTSVYQSEIPSNIFRYALPLLAVANIILSSQAGINSPIKSQSNNLNPNCFNTSSLNDPETDKVEYVEKINILNESIGIQSPEQQVISGIPMTITRQGTTLPVSNFPPTNSKAESSSIMICDDEIEQNFSNNSQSTVEINNTKELTSTVNYTVTISTEAKSNIVSPKETNFHSSLSPQEPTIEIFKDQETGQQTMVIANNNNIKFYSLVTEGKEIKVQATTADIQIREIVAAEHCNILGDVYLRKGPKGEIYIAVMDADRESNTCLLKANSIKEAMEKGFDVHSINWPNANLADFNTIDTVEINGKSHLLASINALLDLGSTNGDYYGQPIALIEDKGDILEGKLFVPKNIFGQSVSFITDYKTDKGEILGLRVIDGYPNTNRIDQISSHVLNPKTDVLTVTENILTIALPNEKGGCKTIPNIGSTCVPQVEKGSPVRPTSRFLEKVTRPTLMDDGRKRIPYNAIVDINPEPDKIQTDLFVEQLILGNDGTLTRDLSAIYSFEDENQQKINYIDPLIQINPDGSMQILAITLNLNGTNSLITFEANPDGSPKGSASILQSTTDPFPGNNPRGGDYHGQSEGENIRVYSFFMGTKSIIAFNPAPGFTVKVIPPEIVQPTPTSTQTPVSTNNLFLPLTRR